MSDRHLMYYQDVEQIKRFDILISDPHKSGDPYTAIEGSVGLTLQEVWDWLSNCGEWSFIVTAHNDANNVFLRGTTSYKSMRAAAEGRILMSLCVATEAEAEELAQKTHQRVMQQQVNVLVRYDSPEQIFD